MGLTKIDLEKIYRLMIKARVLETRLIKMSKSDDGYFWIGGPGEEAFNVPLGLLIQKGEGLDYDYCHFHYRASACLLAMGSPMIDSIRQMANRSSDPFSGGRNFVSHYAIKEWNIMPVTSPIEVQYVMAPGTAWAQKKHNANGITIVTGGDAGTAEGDFASCLQWSSRPNMELPILIIVTNNHYGISTPFDQVHGDSVIAKRAESFGIKWSTVNGNDPIASYKKLEEAMNYVRSEKKPFCLEAYVSRLHGHSSSSGGNRVENEIDCIEEFEGILIKEQILSEKDCVELKETYEKEALDALKQVREEPFPLADTVFQHIYKETK
ncbi:MAG: thiamine pyrophosphate-dependent dehydrogenase E1 component subunit alpha [Bdellovibrionales bacterium]|nr:thiamine pyrophosphate-dependent dehydrogenase E1 component subunit alpha [Bdellovibrionales bacterium]